MADVFRITDRFKLTGRGIVYTVKTDEKAIIHVGDVLYDLHGNQFKVKGIGKMFSQPINEVSLDVILIDMMFDLISGVEAEGNILVRDLLDVNFLFCNHPLYPNRVDEDYEDEFQAAGLDHPCALFSYEDLEAGKISLYGEEISGLTIYRGWMMKPEMYRKFWDLLEKKGIILINTPEEYERYHLLPEWYGDFKEETPESVWTASDQLEDAVQISKELEGSYIVKDYVKSRKHEWYDACFVKNIGDEETLSKVVGNFIERQGSDLVGGVVFRKYENLKQIGFHQRSGMPLSEEYRVFIYAPKRSRSGNGGHLWIFFKEEIEAGIARQLGIKVLESAMNRLGSTKFDSFDRLFPNQDRMPKGGYGNLIALPLQRQSVENGNGVFVDDAFRMYSSQTAVLQGMSRYSRSDIMSVLAQFPDVILEVGEKEIEEEDKALPWEKKQAEKIPEDLPESIDIVLYDKIYISRRNLHPFLKKKFVGITVFHNPEYYQARNLRKSVQDIPMWIQCFDEDADYLMIPAGCRETLEEICTAYGGKPEPLPQK